jgi:hypothetical protein
VELTHHFLREFLIIPELEPLHLGKIPEAVNLSMENSQYGFYRSLFA